MAKTSTDEEGKRVKSVQRSYKIVDTLTDAGSMQIADVANALGIPESTAHVHLKTLESVGYVIKDDYGYTLSLRFLQNGITVRQRQRIYATAKSEIDTLAEETQEVASLGVEENLLRVILHQHEGSEAVYDNAPIGEYTNMHWTALGKAILAERPTEHIEKVIDTHGLPGKTENTVTDRGELLSRLDSIKEQGYALEDEERREGIRSLSIPILVGEEPIGAISLTGPKERFEDQRIEEELLPELQSATNIVEIKYAYD